jgi:hypothetical protein
LTDIKERTTPFCFARDPVKCNFLNDGWNIETETDAEDILRPFAGKLMDMLREAPAGDVQVGAEYCCGQA